MKSVCCSSKILRDIDELWGREKQGPFIDTLLRKEPICLDSAESMTKSYAHAYTVHKFAQMLDTSWHIYTSYRCDDTFSENWRHVPQISCGWPHSLRKGEMVNESLGNKHATQGDDHHQHQQHRHDLILQASGSKAKWMSFRPFDSKSPSMDASSTPCRARCMASSCSHSSGCGRTPRWTGGSIKDHKPSKHPQGMAVHLQVT